MEDNNDVLTRLRAHRDDLLRQLKDADTAIDVLERLDGAGGKVAPTVNQGGQAAHSRPARKRRPRALRNFGKFDSDFINNLDGDQIRAIALAVEKAGPAGITSPEIEKITGINHKSIGKPLAIFRRAGQIWSEEVKPQQKS